MASSASPPGTPDAYQAGVCNIGPAEIARRRRAGHLGALATLAALAVLVALHLPPLARMLVALPAAGAAIGYLQAYLRFCVAFGSAGVFNFGPTGTTELVVDRVARTRDRIRSLQIGLAGAAVGLIVGGLAVLLPV